ncbi:hypothetical protein INS49_007104 [Diaporthe citri]|uniref:uncharacterized protein n=1 Tax=Diaporthe citri TaxID=83186 RepID=UPI001C807361|nr:uncharacterized protein INS49_007104 [Diaporthe citri]KAG6365493.1 hypothetical protein INS49_007104 [Diaporthe citri]
MLPTASRVLHRRYRASVLPPEQAEVHHVQPLGWQEDPQVETWKLADLEYTVPPVFLRQMLVFKTNKNDDPGKTTERLIKALGITLSQCRTLTGVFEKEAGEVKIVRARGATVPFVVQHDHSVSLQDLQSNGFPESIVGSHAHEDHEKASRAGISSITDGQPLCKVQATWIPGGLVLTAGFHHYCTDGAGFWAFLRQWASNSSALKRNAELPPWDPACLGRQRLNGRLVPPEERTDPPPEPESAAPAVTADHQCRLVVLHLHNANVGRLKAAASTPGQAVSAYDAVTALLWQAHTRARLSIYDPRPDEVTFLGQAVDLRPRFTPPLQPQLQANAMLGVLTPFIPVRDAVAGGSGLASLASLVRRAHMGATEDTARERAGAVAALRDKTLAAWKGGRAPRFGMAMSDWRRGGIYEADFGCGKPLAVRAMYQPGHPCTITDLPTGEEGGRAPGVEVQIPVEVACLDRFVKDAELLQYATVVSV